MKKSIIAILFCLLISSSTYGELFNGVEFPDGSSSFADAVVSYEPSYGGGPIPTSADHQNSKEAIGTPDWTGVDGGAGTVSLGNGGRITLQFTNNALTGSGDSSADLYIFEVGSAVEDTFVEISKDGTNFISIGKVYGSLASIDIDAYGYTQSDKFHFVRLTDDRDENYYEGATAGADIDAVGAISSVEVDQTECIVEINGITVSGTKEIGSPVTFTTNARNSCSNTLYYRYSVHPDYGTNGYDGLHWEIMTSSEYTTESSIDYTFDEAGKYIVVVWAKNTTSDSNDGVAIVGIDVTIKDQGEEPYFPF